MRKKRIITLLLSFAMILSGFSSVFVANTQEASAATANVKITKQSKKYYSGDNGTRVYEFEGLTGQNADGKKIQGKAFCANYSRHNADVGSKGTRKNITKSDKSKYKKIVRIMYWTAYRHKDIYSSPSKNADKKKLLVLHYTLSYLYSNMDNIKSWGIWDDCKDLIDKYGDKTIPADDKPYFKVFVWTDKNNKYQPLIGWKFSEPTPEKPSLIVSKTVVNDETGEETEGEDFEFQLEGVFSSRSKAENTSNTGSYNETMITDESGEANFDELEPGFYRLTEHLNQEQTDAGYIAMDPNPAIIEIKASDEEVTYNAVNHKGDEGEGPKLEIIKKTSDGSAVSGFTFNVKGVNSSGATIIDKDYVTPASGRIFIRAKENGDPLEAGTYTVTEKLTESQKQQYVQPEPQTKTIEANSMGTFTFNFLNSPEDKKEYDKINLLLRKVDKETGGSVPINAGTLEGAVFEIKYFKNEDGYTYGDADRTWQFQTDSKGEIYLNPETGSIDDYYIGGDGLFSMEDADGNIFYYMPLGTYQVKEKKAPEGYVVDPKTEIIVLNDDQNSETTTDEWNLVPMEQKTFNDAVKRCDVHFEKQDENGHPLTYIPFVITHVETGETHYVLTDANGKFDSAVIPHTTNTNAFDSLASYDESGETIPQSVIDGLKGETSGTWFGQLTDGTPVEPNDDYRALPYGNYTLRELRCDGNANRNLIPERHFSVLVNDENIDIGTIVEPNIKIETLARDRDNNNHNGTVAEDSQIIDKVQYWTLQTNRRYKLEAELHWAKGIDGHKINGGIVKDANGEEIRGEVEFEPYETDDEIEVKLGPFDSTKLMVGSTELEGEDTVVYEYLYDITDGEKTLVAQHTDPGDKNQIISYPWISTYLTDNDTGIRMGFAREDMRLTDTIKYKNLRRHQEYHVIATLYDQETGLAIKRANGTQVINGDGNSGEWFTAEETDGIFRVNYRFDSSELAGKTLVSLVTVSGNDATIKHLNKKDEMQTLHIPKIRTDAYDAETNDEVGKVVGTFKDTVTYENLLPNLHYNMKMEIMDKDSGESTGITAVQKFHAVANEHDNNRSDGKVTVTRELTDEFTKDELEGKTLVSFEECYVLEKQVGDMPTVDSKVAEHKDINDEAQTVWYPMIRTTGRDGKTDDHVGTVVEDGKAIDTVECWNLVPGKEYTLEGTYWDTDDNAVLTTGTTTFTAEEAHEFHEVEFDLNTMGLDGHTSVIYEKLYHNGVEVTQHEEWDEEQQRVHYPRIETEATDSLTADHVGTILGKLINGFRRVIGQDVADDDFAGIVDNVKYWNTLPDMEYKLVGTLMNKETGEKILDENGQPITAERIIEANKHDANGEINLYFPVDTSRLENVTVVCYEKLFHNNAETGEPVEVTRHEDINDEDQSVHEVELRTHANDQHVASDGIVLEVGSDGIIAPDNYKGPHYDWHTGDATGSNSKTYPNDTHTIIRDDVSMKNLVNGMTYTLVGTLHDKATGEVVTDPDDMPYTVKKTFTVQRDTDEKRVDTVVPIEFKVDGKFLEGRTVVAFEELYHNDILISVHTDINDEAQSVYYPWIRTKAEDNKNGAKETQVNPETEILDHVYYRNLLPGKYVIEGVLMDRQSDDGYLHDAAGNKVTASKTFTITSKEEGKEGTRDLVFKFDSTLLKDHIAVAFENLYLLDENDPNYKVHIATHEDMSDEAESEWIIDIATKLTDTMDDSDEGEERADAEWNDHVVYWGLIPGKEYTIRGILMDKDSVSIGSDGLVTGEPEPFRDANGDLVEGEATFIPENSCGYVDVKFEGDTTGLAGKTVVAFEKLYPSDVPEAVIATHEDITDPAQAVNIIKIETDMDDQDTTTNIAMAKKGSLYTDHVSYTNLTVGRDYILKAVLMDKATERPVRDENGEVVTGETRFTPEEKDGTVDVEFELDASKLAGRTLVSFERLYNAEFEDVYVAHHEDIEDEDQSIHVPKIRTKAKLKNKKVIDKMIYRNLLEGEKYVARGYLVRTSDGKKLKGSEGYRKFTATDANGSINVTLPVPHYSKLGGMKLTAYEELYIIVDGEEILVGEHKVLKDRPQIVKIPRGPKTGDNALWFFYAAFFLSASSLCFVMRRRAKGKIR